MPYFHVLKPLLKAIAHPLFLTVPKYVCGKVMFSQVCSPEGWGRGAGKYQIHHGISDMVIYPSERSCRLPPSGKGQAEYPLLVTPGGGY